MHILVGENVGKLECTKHRSLLTVRSLYSMSRRIRYGDVILLQNSVFNVFGMTQSRKGVEILWVCLTKRGLHSTRRDRHEKRDFHMFCGLRCCSDSKIFSIYG
jgi:hypothetical protein